jgi:YggT family protein
MSLIALVVYWALQIYFLVLVARFILDLVLSVNPSWRPKGPVLVLAEISFTLTDPPLKALRRFIPPLRLGMFSIDLAWTILLFGVLFAERIVATFI